MEKKYVYDYKTNKDSYTVNIADYKTSTTTAEVQNNQSENNIKEKRPWTMKLTEEERDIIVNYRRNGSVVVIADFPDFETLEYSRFLYGKDVEKFRDFIKSVANLPNQTTYIKNGTFNKEEDETIQTLFKGDCQEVGANVWDEPNDINEEPNEKWLDEEDEYIPFDCDGLNCRGCHYCD